MSKEYQLSVLIPTCNREKLLKCCIDSLLKQKTSAEYEIIVLNQSDDPCTLPESKELEAISCNFKNKSRALNVGVRKASADYIAVIDDDCIASEHWIDNLLSAIEDVNKNSIVTGRVVAGEPEDGAVPSRLHDSSTSKTKFQKGWTTPIFNMSGCNFCFHKDLYDVIGPFNEKLGPGSSFKSSDDNEWSYRALNLGFSIIYDPNSVVTHRSWRSANQDFELMEDYGYAAGAFFKIIFNNSKIDFIYHLFQLHSWHLRNAFFSSNPRKRKTHFQYLTYFYKGFFKYKHVQERHVDDLFVLSPGSFIGGAERYNQNLAQELQKQKRNIIIGVSHNYEFYQECIQDYPTVYLGDNLITASSRLKFFLRNLGAKNIFSNGYHSTYLVNMTKLRNLFQSSSFFIDIKHGWITTGFSEKLKTFFDKALTLLSDAVVIVEPQMQKKLWFFDDQKITHFPSSVLFSNGSPSNSDEGDSLNVLLVGRLAEEKRFNMCLEALSLISEDLWELTIVGNGPEMDTLKDFAKEADIEPSVTFTGYKKNVTPYYEKADLLIISSISEGCPLVALEAMREGVIVLSTNVGYMSTLIGEDRGFLIQKDSSPTLLAKAIRKVMDMTEKERGRMLSRAYEYVFENHNISTNAKKFTNLNKTAKKQ